MTQILSAYEQLSGPERLFVDGYLDAIKLRALTEKISVYEVLQQPVTVANATDMLARPFVQAAIFAEATRIADEQELSVQRIVQEWMQIAFATMEDYHGLDSKNEPTLDFGNLQSEQWRAIQEITIDEKMSVMGGVTRKIKIKLYDKIAALDRLARYVGIDKSDNPFWELQAIKTNAKQPVTNSKESLEQYYGNMLDG